MPLTDDESALNRRLLGFVVTHPGPLRMLRLAIGTGLALGYELAIKRERRDVMDILAASASACDAACDVILRHWVKASRAGGLDVNEFQTLVADVIRVARAS